MNTVSAPVAPPNQHPPDQLPPDQPPPDKLPADQPTPDQPPPDPLPMDRLPAHTPPILLNDGRQEQLQTHSIISSTFAQSWRPCATSNSLDHDIQVHLPTHSIMAS